MIALRPWYTHVFLGPAELAAVCSKLGRVPTVAECQQAVGIIDTTSGSPGTRAVRLFDASFCFEREKFLHHGQPFEFWVLVQQNSALLCSTCGNPGVCDR